MSFSNPQRHQLNFKILYVGPTGSGKTQTLNHLHKHYAKKKTGSVKSLSRLPDETAFFDFVPLSLGKVGSQQIRVHLYAVPSPVLFEGHRRLLLTGVDGVVFVADARLSCLDENLIALQGLEESLRDQDLFLEELPLVFQYNKQDLRNALVPTIELNRILNTTERPFFESSALKDKNLVEPLEVLMKQVLRELHYPE